MRDSDNKVLSGAAKVRAVTYLGVVVNVVLSVIKIAAGSLAGSIALVADGVHSFSDMLTDVVVLLGVHFGSKGPDEKHPYGHGRVETFSAMGVALVLIAVGGFMIYKAAMAIAVIQGGQEDGCEVGFIVMIIAIISIAAKEVIYWVTRRVAVATGSSALYANAWHHRSDAISSVAVLIGFASVKMGYVMGDQVAAIAVALMIILVGVKITGKCFEEFAERSADSETIGQIKEIIASEKRIHHWHKLRTRSVGREIFIDLHILVDATLNITDAHEISEALENAIYEQITRPVNITVHIEPDKPELRVH